MQVDLNIRWAHMFKGTFSHFVALAQDALSLRISLMRNAQTQSILRMRTIIKKGVPSVDTFYSIH